MSRYRSMEELAPVFAERQEAIRTRLSEFRAVKPEEYFYELAYCLLTPQSSAEHAAIAVDRLKRADFQNAGGDPVPILMDRSSYIRFHNTKARRLLAARANVGAIMRELTNGSGGEQLRPWLVREVSGLGWKEASHFLRNIGHPNLAILDRHILRNLKKHGVIRSVPESLTKKQYLVTEAGFRRFAGHVGISLDELDLLFWSLETGRIMK